MFKHHDHNEIHRNNFNINLLSRTVNLTIWINICGTNVTSFFQTVETVNKNILNLRQLSLFIWETTLANRRIPDRSGEPYPLANREQTKHARGPVHLRTFRYINSVFLNLHKECSLFCARMPKVATNAKGRTHTFQINLS